MIKSRILLAGALLAVCWGGQCRYYGDSGRRMGLRLPRYFTDRRRSGPAGRPDLHPCERLSTWAHGPATSISDLVTQRSNWTSSPAFAGGDANEAVGYDVGIIYYTYISASGLNFPEVYGGLTQGPFNVKLSYSWDFGGTSEDAYYIEGNGTFPLGDSGFSALAHVGWSDGSYWKDFYGDGYFDWSVGVTYTFKHFTGTVKYIDGSDLRGRRLEDLQDRRQGLGGYPDHAALEV